LSSSPGRDILQLRFEEDWEDRLPKEVIEGKGVGGTSEGGSSREAVEGVDDELVVLTVDEELNRRGSSRRDRRLRNEMDLGRKESGEVGETSQWRLEVGRDGPGCGEEGRREPRMEDCMEDLVGEADDRGEEAIEETGDVGRMVLVGDGGTASMAGSSSWLKRKIWLRGRERRLDRVFFSAREATDGVMGLAFSSLLGGGLGTV
jgi:hypothetical protein